MTQYYIVEPEVAGGLGENTESTSILGHHRKVNRFHYEFYGWLGDAFLESVANYIGTERLAEAIESNKFSGIQFDVVEITKSEFFMDMHPSKKLPKFLWFKIDGTPEKDDFGLTDKLDLVVSQNALDVLKQHGLNHAEIVPISS